METYKTNILSTKKRSSDWCISNKFPQLIQIHKFK